MAGEGGSAQAEAPIGIDWASILCWGGKVSPGKKRREGKKDSESFRLNGGSRAMKWMQVDSSKSSGRWQTWKTQVSSKSKEEEETTRRRRRKKKAKRFRDGDEWIRLEHSALSTTPSFVFVGSFVGSFVCYTPVSEALWLTPKLHTLFFIWISFSALFVHRPAPGGAHRTKPNNKWISILPTHATTSSTNKTIGTRDESFDWII